ncbi:DNA damage-binding protein 1 [Babesia microti strain RI]|uniref:DNA damage-binding protein 1 n=1 Tax=Babesia microti (strain RI) TaxID=1133968 RepID=A0A1R4A9Z0_BABMR|nr:DNA damage-binding protein 1 [Babesia microti strain RI]SJK85828.1 DNA damage-binding protein 1 [Babesia microti strain RI]|eukprot:XP_021338046.1 DNA damage-binding protein 1 [Babesia microti strain RI]
MYGLFRTVTPSQSIHSIIHSSFNEHDLIVCQRNACLDFYSLSSDYIPKLVRSFRGNCTFLKTFTYNPPTDSSTTLLILTVKYELLALKLIDDEFETKLLVNFQENGVEKIDTDPLLLVDPSYKLILFYGYNKLLKCILLDKTDYFDFKNVVNLRTNYDRIVDLFFTNNLYNSLEYTNKLRQSTTFNDTCSLSVNGFADAREFLRPKRITKDQPVNVDNVLLLQVGLVLLLQPEDDASHRHIEIVKLYFEMFNGKSDKIDKSYILGYGYEQIANTLIIDKSVSKILSYPPETDTKGILFVGSSIVGYKHLNDKIDLCQIHNGHLVAEIDFICYKGLQRSLSRIGDDETHLYYACDVTGQLYMFKITIKHEKDKYLINDKMRNLDTIIPLYTISPFSLLLALSDDCIFVATRVGDSKILQLSNGKVSEIWSKPSLSPIIDATVIGGNCTDQLIAVSGIGKSANISILTIGLFFHNICNISLAKVSKLFIISSQPEMIFLVAITSTQSYYFKMVDQSIELISRGDKIICAFQYNNQLYQLTPNSIRISTIDNPRITKVLWTSDEPIVHYLKCENMLIISGGYNLSALVIDKSDPIKITYNHIQSFTSPISAIALVENMNKLHILVATFTNVLLIVDCETKSIGTICEIPTRTSCVGVSDLVYVVKNSIYYIFIGLTDGNLLVYTNEREDVRHFLECKGWEFFMSKNFGVYPLYFKHNSQRLTLIGQHVHFVTFSPITGRIVDFLSLEVPPVRDLEFISDDLLIASLTDHLELGKLSDCNSLDVRRIPVSGALDLIEYHQPSNCVIVAFPQLTSESIFPSNAYIAVYSFVTGLLVTTYYLEQSFEGSSISTFTRGSDKTLLIGISSTDSDYLPSQGRIVACIYNNSTFTFKDSYKFDKDLPEVPSGGVLQICTSKNFVFAGVNHSLVVLTPILHGRSWEGELSPIYIYSECNMIIGIDVCNDLVLLTDIITGVKLLKIFSDTNGDSVEEIAKDTDTSWCSCAKLIDQNHILVSDTKGNITLLKLIDEPINDEQCYILTKIAKFHLGECVNKIVIGKFACYAVSATGAIYEFKFVDLKTFAPLHIFEQSLIKVLGRKNNIKIANLGDYGDPREFRKVDKLCNFVDEDLLGIIYKLGDELLIDIANEACTMGSKFNYSFGVSHLLKWKYLEYDELLVGYDNLILSL